MIKRLVAVAASLIGVLPAAAQSDAQPSAGGEHFVVFNQAGPKFDQIRERPDLIEAHRGLYDGFADDCLTLFGGRLAGDTPLGFRVFVAGVDEDAVKARAEADPAVAEDYIALDYRKLHVQYGDLSSLDPDCQIPENDGGTPDGP